MLVVHSGHAYVALGAYSRRVAFIATNSNQSITHLELAE